MKFTEYKLKFFAAPLSETENQKCLNAIGMIRDSMKMLGFTDDNKSREEPRARHQVKKLF